MFGQGAGVRVLAFLCVGTAVAAGAPGGEKLTPSQWKALEKEAKELSVRAQGLYLQRKLPEATAAFEKVLAACRRLYPEDHSHLATSLNNLGLVLRERGNLADAEPLIRDALAMRRRLFPDGHPDLAHSLNNLGLFLRARRDLGGAEKHFREALALRQRLYPDGHLDLAQSLYNLGSLLQARGDLGGAEQHLREALAMRQRLYRKDLPLLADGLSHLGLLLRQRGDLAGAEQHMREALAMYQRLYPKDHPSVAISLNNLGVLLREREDLAGAEKHLRDALAIRRRLHRKDHPDLADSLSNLGAVLRERGDLDGAEKILREALAMRRRLYSDDHPDLAHIFFDLGSLLQSRGGLDEAEPLLRDALAMRRRLYRNDHPDLARSLRALGSLSQDRGDLAEAERHFREALAMCRRLYRKDHPDLAKGFNDLGVLLQRRGDLAGAETHLREALALRRRLYPKDHPDLAASLYNLGVLLRSRGDRAGAEKRHRESLAMLRRLYPEDHRLLAVGLSALGTVLQQQGDLVGAEKHYRESLAMFQRLYPNDHPFVATGLLKLGGLLGGRGDLAGAEKRYREALAMSQRLSPRGHPDQALSLTLLGTLQWMRGDLPGAEKFLREALAVNRRLYPTDHPNLALSLTNLGFLMRGRGDLNGSEKHLRDALAMCQRFLLKEAGALAEADALNLAATLPVTRDPYLSAARGRRADLADYDLLWQGRAALTRVLEQRHRDLLASRDPAARALGDRLLDARRALARLLLAPAGDAAEHAEKVRTLTAAKEGLEKELAQRLRLELPPADPTPPPPGRLAAALPAGACFLDFYRYTHYTFDPNVKVLQGERCPPHYAVFVVAKGRPVVRVELGEAAPLEKAWAAWHDAITRGAPERQERRAAAALAKLVWEPIRAQLPPGTDTLYLAPDGALTQVPFAALPGTRPSTVLLEQYAFATVPHGPFLLDRLARPAAPRSPGGGLLAVGGVEYAPAAAGRPLTWPALPGTAAELGRVAALAAKRAGLQADRLTGGAATTRAVLAVLPRARFAHLATHGFFAGPGLLSAFQADPEQFLRRTPDRRGGARSPLVLSGLVFAGANRTGADADPDRGILTAEAIVGLRLDGLELAVLSACNTGLGEVGGGEGVYGLQRAFHIAGCRNVVASLWAVDDDATAALMALFYRNLWERKLDPLQALRQAQLELYRHPRQVKEIVTRADDWTPRPLPEEDPGAAGPRARTAQWAAFTFSGVAAPPRAGN